MQYHFQQIKPILDQEFDLILEHYPTPLPFAKEAILQPHFSDFKVSCCGDSAIRKLRLFTATIRQCPIHIFPHFPFAFEIDCGIIRNLCHDGIGYLCKETSGVDFTPLQHLREMLDKENLGCFNDFTDILHRTLDHEKLLHRGLKGVYQDCVQYNLHETDPAKKAYRQLLIELCLLVKELGERFEKQASQLLSEVEKKAKEQATEDSAYLLQNLTRMVNAANVPWEPAATMHEALTSILRIALIISGLDGVEMNCMGLIDQLIFPFYEKDLQEGTLSKEEAYFLLQCFLYKTDCHAHFNEERTSYDNGVSIMVGGCDKAGTPVYNPVTEMVLQAYIDHPYINPKLNARAGSRSPRAYLEKLTALMASGHNNLVIENDDYIIPMFERMGLDLPDARSYIGNGCQEVVCPNQQHSRAFVYLNTVQVLLNTIKTCYGTIDPCPGSSAPDTTATDVPYSFDAFYDQYLSNLRSLIQTITETFKPFESIQDQINLEALLSAFTGDCVEKGLDITQGGARYYHKTLSLVGFGTLCDSLLAIKEAIETDNLPELLAATRSGFNGYELLQQTLQKNTLRFGHSEEGDAFAAKLAKDLGNVSQGITNAHGIPWHTSLFTYYQFAPFGQKTAATPDGRAAFTPFSRQMNMAVLPDLTTAVRSMSTLSQADFHDVGMFDLAFPLMTSDSENFWKTLPDFIKTCIDFQIPVLQTNISDPKLLKEEREHHGTHPDLVVRVCGYSAMFSQLSETMQTKLLQE